MTIKQAAMWLCQPGIVSMIHDPTTKKALSVAVKALAESEHGTNLAEVGTDCISRQQVLEVLGELATFTEDWSCHTWMYTDDVYNAIKQLPPIQPKRGKWIKTARWGRVYYCDQCRNYLDFDGVNAGRGSTNYCPNCGCRMDGGEP